MSPSIAQIAATSLVSFSLGSGFAWWLLIRRRACSITNTPCKPTSAYPVQPTFVHPPDSSWKPGQKQPAPFPPDGSKMMVVDPTVVDKGHLYSLLISAVTPRPIGFVSTVGIDGKGNLAPYSYFNMVCRRKQDWTQNMSLLN